MAFSAAEGKQFFKEWFNYFCLDDEYKITHVLDIGAGAGLYADLIHEVSGAAIVDAVEIYNPYIDQFNLRSKYRHIYVEDAVEFEPQEKYDLIILGDVLEHIDPKTAYHFFMNLKMKARFIFLSLPVKPFRPWFWGYNQPACDYAENIREKHVTDWDYGLLVDMFGPFLWQVPFRTVVVLVAEGITQ